MQPGGEQRALAIARRYYSCLLSCSHQDMLLLGIQIQRSQFVQLNSGGNSKVVIH